MILTARNQEIHHVIGLAASPKSQCNYDTFLSSRFILLYENKNKYLGGLTLLDVYYGRTLLVLYEWVNLLRSFRRFQIEDCSSSGHPIDQYSKISGFKLLNNKEPIFAICTISLVVVSRRRDNPETEQVLIEALKTFLCILHVDAGNGKLGFIQLFDLEVEGKQA
jgi:hypothetical protein